MSNLSAATLPPLPFLFFKLVFQPPDLSLLTLTCNFNFKRLLTGRRLFAHAAFMLPLDNQTKARQTVHAYCESLPSSLTLWSIIAASSSLHQWRQYSPLHTSLFTINLDAAAKVWMKSRDQRYRRGFAKKCALNGTCALAFPILTTSKSFVGVLLLMVLGWLFVVVVLLLRCFISEEIIDG